MFRILFVLFLLIPIIEIYFLIQVGSVIGAAWTVFLVVGTAVLGAFLLRLQGFNTLQRAQISMAQGTLPAIEMLEGVSLLISGAMLLTPGFVTDSVGFLLLVPVIRRGLIARMLANSQMLFSQRTSFYQQGQQRSHADDSIIEGEVVTDEDKRHLP